MILIFTLGPKKLLLMSLFILELSSKFSGGFYSIIICGAIITLITSALDGLVYLFKKVSLYKTTSSKVNCIRIKKFHGSLIFFSGFSFAETGDS